MSDSRSVPRQGTVRRSASAGVAALAALSIYLMPMAAQQPSRGRVTIAPASTAEVRAWAPRIDSLRRSGELRLRIRRDDPLTVGRAHERYDQYYRGVRVYGGDVAEQLNGGQVVSAFGNVYEGIDIDTSPTITAERAREVIEARAGVEIGRAPELVILPRDGSYLLAWRVRAAAQGDVREYFVDARNGAIAFEFSDLKTQSAVGRGQGVLGDTKKISVSPSGGQFVTTDRLRPPAVNTYDMRGDYVRTINYLNEVIQLTTQRPRRGQRQHLDGRRDGGRPRLHRLDLRLLLQALQPPRPRQPRPPARQPRPSRAALGLPAGLPARARLLPQRRLLRRRHHGLRRRPAALDSPPAARPSTSSRRRSTSWPTSSPTGSPTTRRT